MCLRQSARVLTHAALWGSKHICPRRHISYGHGNEDFGALRYAGDKLIHIHFSNPTAKDSPNGGKMKRIFPAEGDGYNYAPFVQAVKKAGYDGRMSIEANCINFEAEAAEGLKMMKNLLE